MATLQLTQLTTDRRWFPPVTNALDEASGAAGLLAFGGDLHPERLYHAYQQGIFPWFNPGEPPLWWSPPTRAIFRPQALAWTRTMLKAARQQQFSFTVNHAFTEVMQGCAAPRAKQSGTWIVPAIIAGYTGLHHAGHAHSIEVWQQQQLVGGLYGVMVGQLFCGESMFNRVPNAAKAALMLLQQLLQQAGGGYIDCQMPNAFLLQMGAEPLPRAHYLSLLATLKSQHLADDCWQKGPRQIQRS